MIEKGRAVARGLNALGCRTFCAASHSADHWDSISPFFAGGTHIPRAQLAARATDTNGGVWPQTALRPEKAFEKGKKRHGRGFANPKLESGVKISKRNDTAQLGPSGTETSPHLLDTG